MTSFLTFTCCSDSSKHKMPSIQMEFESGIFAQVQYSHVFRIIVLKIYLTSLKGWCSSITRLLYVFYYVISKTCNENAVQWNLTGRCKISKSGLIIS